MKKTLIFALWLSMATFSAGAEENPSVNISINSFAPLVEKVSSAVVNISAERGNENSSAERFTITSTNPLLRDYFLLDEGGKVSQGSGFVIDAKGIIVTNYHVIKDTLNIKVIMHDGRSFVAQILGVDEPTDIALLQINDAKPFDFVEIGDSDNLKVGDWVVTAGNPFGLGTSFSAGIVSAKSRDIDMGIYDNFIQTDASINQGSSGGPMFDIDGNVVGINTALFSATGESVGVGFATPANISKFVISRLLEKGKVERSWIGVQIANQDQELPISASQKFTGGVSVTSVTPDSPAQTSGIEAGDIVIQLNGKDVKDSKDFSRRIAEMPIGRDIILRVWRNGKTSDFALQTALRPQPVTTAPEPVVPEYSEDGYVPNLGMAFGMGENGVFVRDVLRNSPANIQGISKGDLVKAVNSHQVTTVADVLSYISYAVSGDKMLDMTIESEGVERNVNLEIMDIEMPEDNSETSGELAQ